MNPWSVRFAEGSSGPTNGELVTREGGDEQKDARQMGGTRQVGNPENPSRRGSRKGRSGRRTRQSAGAPPKTSEPYRLPYSNDYRPSQSGKPYPPPSFIPPPGFSMESHPGDPRTSILPNGPPYSFPPANLYNAVIPRGGPSVMGEPTTQGFNGNFPHTGTSSSNVGKKPKSTKKSSRGGRKAGKKVTRESRPVEFPDKGWPSRERSRDVGDRTFPWAPSMLTYPTSSFIEETEGFRASKRSRDTDQGQMHANVGSMVENGDDDREYSPALKRTRITMMTSEQPESGTGLLVGKEGEFGSLNASGSVTTTHGLAERAASSIKKDRVAQIPCDARLPAKPEEDSKETFSKMTPGMDTVLEELAKSQAVLTEIGAGILVALRKIADGIEKLEPTRLEADSKT